MNKGFEQSFQIIANAGDARFKADEAIKFAEQGDFKKSEEKIKESKESLRLAHQTQTEMINAEVSGDKQELSILMIHGQDHFAMATTAIDMAEYILCLYRKIADLEKRLPE